MPSACDRLITAHSTAQAIISPFYFTVIVPLGGRYRENKEPETGLFADMILLPLFKDFITYLYPICMNNQHLSSTCDIHKVYKVLFTNGLYSFCLLNPHNP